MKHKQYLFAFLVVIINASALYPQESRTLDDFKSLGRDSIIGCAKHELMWRHKKLGLNMNGYYRIQVLAGIENGKEALYVNFDNPIRFREIVNPDRIGINLLSGESYFSSRGDIENFYYRENSTLMQEFLSCLGNSQTNGQIKALPGIESPTSSYIEVIDYGDHYGFTVVSGSNAVDYRLKKSNFALKETSRNNTGSSEPEKPYLEEIK
ncbi:MAG TPA: hypothetical protein VGK25_05985 [Ignavibacteria bacterium]|jgi:hypothetical protein